MNNISPTPASALRLWQLISPALPVGAYAYSQGLESACELGWVSDEASAQEWIQGLLSHSIAPLDIPIFERMYRAWQNEDLVNVTYWNQFLLASRESMEIKKEDIQLGYALRRLLVDLHEWDARDTQGQHAHGRSDEYSYACWFAYAAQHWHIPVTDAANGYCWAWSENQVAAAIKLIPLGQTAGQRILSHVLQRIPAAVTQGLDLQDDDIGSTLPGLAIGSALHETQYSRLFRS